MRADTSTRQYFVRCGRYSIYTSMALYIFVAYCTLPSASTLNIWNSRMRASDAEERMFRRI